MPTKVLLNNVFNWVRRYKILHILFWVWNFIDLVHLQQQNNATFNKALHNVIAVKAAQMSCVYFLVYYLMPRLLYKGHYLKFIALALLCIPACALFTLGLQELDKWFTVGKWMNTAFLPLLFITNSVEAFMISGFFFAVYAIEHTFVTERRNQRLEKERLESELNFLKAQINPHFLFNSINSIYVLIEEDKKLASQTLLKFSGLLRYQLYDCTNHHMPLERELEFLKDYVDLEIIRSGSDVAITFHALPVAGYLHIAPFILVPFVENAFKHRSHKKSGNYVNIHIQAKDNTLHFCVSNSYDEQVTPATRYGGIGLQNVQRRLQLLYPNKHILKIEQDNGVYSVNLQLELNEDTVHISR